MNETTTRPEPRTLPWRRGGPLVPAPQAEGADRRPCRRRPAISAIGSKRRCRRPPPRTDLAADLLATRRAVLTAALRPDASRSRRSAPSSPRDAPAAAFRPAPGPARAGPSRRERAPARESGS